MDRTQHPGTPVKILLVCANGISTSLLKCRAEAYLQPGDYIQAVAYFSVPAKIQDYDVILLGPQMRAYIDQLGELCEKNKKPYGWIDMKVYGTMDGEALVRAAYALLRSGS